eukprot:9766235-Alexandrium_andersonii.AAC.1
MHRHIEFGQALGAHAARPLAVCRTPVELLFSVVQPLVVAGQCSSMAEMASRVVPSVSAARV